MAENAENRLKFINCRPGVRVFTGLNPKQSLAAADHSAFSAMEQHKPELNRKSRVDRCLQLCFISNSKLSWGGDIGNDDQNRAFEQAGFGVL